VVLAADNRQRSATASAGRWDRIPICDAESAHRTCGSELGEDIHLVLAPGEYGSPCFGDLSRESVNRLAQIPRRQILRLGERFVGWIDYL
jgi:hypothetical protein